MGYVYRYTDISDNIIKYVGVVWKETRTMNQRVYEHATRDDWTKGKEWKIEFFQWDNIGEIFSYEGHFISLYKTFNWYNESKTNWGISRYLPKQNWILFNSESVLKTIGTRQGKKSKNKVLENLVNKSICIYNDGNYYNFFSSFKRKPVSLFLALDDEEDIIFARENKIRYLDRKQFNELWEIINIKQKQNIYSYANFPSIEQQILLDENNKNK